MLLLIKKSKLFKNRHILQEFPHLKVSTNSNDYKSTLLLPKSEFPHKIKPLHRVKRDRFIEKQANFETLYNWQKQHRSKLTEFTLHDGPPYASGDLHIGHAVNKILKDITVRYQFLNGRKINFIPGWDCHGLPIELKILQDSKSSINKLETRIKALEFAKKSINNQHMVFKKWGILADWENSYLTCHPSYIIKELQTFQELYDKGIIFQGYKPVFWSPWNRTSLAEAELEYNPQHISQAIYIKFLVNKYPDILKSKLDSSNNLYLLIWTTTPWTLPSNQAVCYASDQKYGIFFCKERKEYFVLACELFSAISNIFKSELILVTSFDASLFDQINYMHPFSKKQDCSLLPSQYVTMAKGTGLVHMAPNHGLEDYSVALKFNMKIDPCIVNEDGCFTNDVDEQLIGKDVLNTGNQTVISLLEKDIIYLHDYVHSYPYDWRSYKPVIIRSSHQWFIDVHQIKEKVVECLQSIEIIPHHIKKSFYNQFEISPQWCISRQRIWGVPIPAFYSYDKNVPFVHRSITNHLCSLIENHGIHCWWDLSIDKLLPSHLKTQCNMIEKEYWKGSDILDIWFDSGISWKCVLQGSQISDICIEGLDQIRGWFNSSLLTSVALRDIPPFKKLFLHGFTTDSEGFKMSKSKGNVVIPDDITEGQKTGNFPALGIDVLRWWVALHACQSENIPLKTSILEECNYDLNKFRNIFKFLLGNLHNFDFDENINLKNMRGLDIYMLHSLEDFSCKITEEYHKMQFKNVAKELINFASNEVSSFYCHLIKDRLYCESQDSHERISCQIVLFHILHVLARCIAPITPHLAEEVFFYHPIEKFAKLGVFRSHLPNLKEFLRDSNYPHSITWAKQIRNTILKSDIKTIDKNISIIGGEKLIQSLKQINLPTMLNNEGMVEIFQASQIICDTKMPINLENNVILNGYLENTNEKIPEKYSIIITQTHLKKCPRCRLYLSKDSSILCNRCIQLVNNQLFCEKIQS